MSCLFLSAAILLKGKEESKKNSCEGVLRTDNNLRSEAKKHISEGEKVSRVQIRINLTLTVIKSHNSALKNLYNVTPFIFKSLKSYQGRSIDQQ